MVIPAYQVIIKFCIILKLCIDTFLNITMTEKCIYPEMTCILTSRRWLEWHVLLLYTSKFNFFFRFKVNFVFFVSIFVIFIIDILLFTTNNINSHRLKRDAADQVNKPRNGGNLPHVSKIFERRGRLREIHRVQGNQGIQYSQESSYLETLPLPSLYKTQNDI